MKLPKTLRLKQVLFIIISFTSNCVYGDWVEIPQFGKKIYNYPNAAKFDTTYATTATLPSVDKNIPNEQNNVHVVLERPPRQHNVPVGIRVKHLNNTTIGENLNFHSFSRNQFRTNAQQNGVEKRVEIDDYSEEEENYSSDEIDHDQDVLDEDANKSNETENGFSYPQILPFLENIQSTLIRTSHKTTKSKINLLEDLKNTLLYNLKEKMSTLWGAKSKTKRSAREYKDDHQMDFHSNEGPLMTIGFLTFAVFLIKLVLKLINALKAKQNVMMMMVPTTTTAAPLIFGRRKRSQLLDDKTAEILNLIEKYKFAN